MAAEVVSLSEYRTDAMRALKVAANDQLVRTQSLLRANRRYRLAVERQRRRRSAEAS